MTKQPKTYISRGKYSSCIKLLERSHDVGKVHSIYEHGLHISFGNELVFIGPENSFGFPFGIHIESFLYDQLLAHTQIGEEVIWDLKLMQLYFVESKFHLIIAMMSTFDCKLKPFPLDAQKLTSIAADLEHIVKHSNLSSHLGIDWKNSRMRYNIFAMSYASLRNREELKKMIHVNESLDVELVRYFIGQGVGISPSGDDFLIGISAVERMMHENGGKVSEALRLLEEDIPQLTTEISQNQFRYTSAGYFNTAILDLIETFGDADYSEIEQACNQLLRIGGSSGADICLGIILALKAYGE